MGLIRKQSGLDHDLKTKIETWAKKSNIVLDITDDLRLRVPNAAREIIIQVILYLLEKESQEFPEYIMFDFSRCDYCAHVYHCGCIDDVIQLFNKADKHFFGINECRIICSGSGRICDLKRINDEWICTKGVMI